MHARQPMSKKEAQPENEAWASYPGTVLVFDGEQEVSIDLRVPVPPQTRNALLALGLGDPFAILTSYNPRGENIAAVENERRFAELEAELRSSGAGYVVMDACSPDRSHCERSVALKKQGRDTAREIAKRWEQVAIFWYDGTRFWIYGAISPMEPIPLPLGSMNRSG